ncbi:MAG: hypothetical protein AAF990_23845 [Bacteroidota bacterium]
MASNEKIYVRNIRKDLGIFPNWPTYRQIGLGEVGYYNGRKAQFDWRTSLNDLKINFERNEVGGAASDMYTSRGSVQHSFNANLSDGSSANFKFSKKNLVATQGYDVSHQTIKIDQLENELRSKIANKEIEWNYDWVILSQIWHTVGFTLLISRSNDASIEIVAGNNFMGDVFNIADVNLGLEHRASKNMSHQVVAKRNPNPFFQIHRFTKKGNLELYGNYNLIQIEKMWDTFRTGIWPK